MYVQISRGRTRSTSLHNCTRPQFLVDIWWTPNVPFENLYHWAIKSLSLILHLLIRWHWSASVSLTCAESSDHVRVDQSALWQILKDYCWIHAASLVFSAGNNINVTYFDSESWKSELTTSRTRWVRITYSVHCTSSYCCLHYTLHKTVRHM